MKVEFLDSQFLMVRATRGWFRKVTAVFHRDSIGGPWRFGGTRALASGRLDRLLDRKTRHCGWVRVDALPTAKVVKM